MALPYQFYRSLQNARSLPFNMQLEVSLSLADGIPLLYSANGKLTPVVNSTDRPLFVLNGAAATTASGSQENYGSSPIVTNTIANGYNATTGPGGNPQVQSVGGFADVLSAGNGSIIWRTTFTPVVPAFVSNTTGSPTSIICPSSPANFAANAFVGGTLLCKSTGQQLRITASSVTTTGNALTFTTVEPLGKIGATINADGLSFIATPLGVGCSGSAGIKFSTASGTVANSGYVPSQLGAGSADWSGGYIQIFDVDVLGNFIYVIFN